uniref:Uncharacterized protein n=1 Tax=viral metagenome TaxID=1070528 RepID=A0A6C0EUE2_9ZZZZ
MSIFTLKKKSMATTQLSNQKSAYNLGFSLNNPRRVGAHTGEPQTQTRFKGLGQVGYGSVSSTINKSQYICVDDPSLPRKTVKSNQAMLSQRNKWLNRGYPYTVVKNCVTDYNSHLTKLKGNVAKKSTINDNGNCLCDKPKSVGNYQKDILTMNYSTYYNSRIFVKECIPLPPSQAHYPPQNKRGIISCNKEQTYEEFKEIQNDIQALC